MNGLASPGGRVTVDLFRRPGVAPQVAFAEPGDVGALLCARTPKAALALVPRVYALCGTAQSHAAAGALEQALGIAVSPHSQAARAALTAMETLREHCLRIVLDWSGFAGLAAPVARLRPAMVLLPELTAALYGTAEPFALGGEAAPDGAAAEAVIARAERLLEEEVFGEPTARWLARRGPDDLRTWAADSGTVAGRLMALVVEAGWQGAGSTPPLPVTLPPVAALRAWLRDGGDALPVRQREVPETTLFSRRHSDPLLASLAGCGLAARLAARLVELARLPGQLRGLTQGTPALPPRNAEGGDGFGCAAVEAARGLLIHAVEIEDGLVARYRILPPTRWNFDGAGVAQRCLGGLSAVDDAGRLRQAEMLVNAIDPCVGHEVRLH